MSNETWRSQAACVGLDTNIFFRVDANYTEAEKICGECPVVTDCLAHTMANEKQYERYGYAGGKSDDERKEIFKEAVRKSLEPEPQPIRESCGENRGYSAHIKRREKPCRPCTVARLAYMKEYERNRKATVS